MDLMVRCSQIGDLGPKRQHIPWQKLMAGPNGVQVEIQRRPRAPAKQIFAITGAWKLMWTCILNMFILGVLSFSWTFPACPFAIKIANQVFIFLIQKKTFRSFRWKTLRALAPNWFSQKPSLRNGPLFLKPALYMVERPWPYTRPHCFQKKKKRRDGCTISLIDMSQSTKRISHANVSFHSDSHPEAPTGELWGSSKQKGSRFVARTHWKVPDVSWLFVRMNLEIDLYGDTFMGFWSVPAQILIGQKHSQLLWECIKGQCQSTESLTNLLPYNTVKSTSRMKFTSTFTVLAFILPLAIAGDQVGLVQVWCSLRN